MIIDNFFDQKNDTSRDKKNFYLGRVSEIFGNRCRVQVENLSIFNVRRVRNDVISAGTINFYVLIESYNGIFIGRVIKSSVGNDSNSKENMINSNKTEVYPNIEVEMVGLLKDNKFVKSGLKHVSIFNNVYYANEKVISTLNNSLEFVKDDDNYENIAKNVIGKNNVCLSPNTLFKNHLLVVGSTNSGKSTSSLMLLDMMLKANKKVLVIDPTGEYSSSFNNIENVKISNLGRDSFLKVSDVSFKMWTSLFNVNDKSQPAVLSNALKSLNYCKDNHINGTLNKNGEYCDNIDKNLASYNDRSFYDFNIDCLSQQIIEESVSINRNFQYYRDDFKLGANMFLSEEVKRILNDQYFKKIFSDGPGLGDDVLKFISSDNDSLYVNLSNIRDSRKVGRFVIEYISSIIMGNREKVETPFLVFIDEAHKYFDDNYNNTNGLIEIGREGRKYGIFLMLSTQRPGDIPDDLLSQFGTLIIHRMRHHDDLNLVNNFLSENNYENIKNLAQGEAIISSVNLLDDIFVKFNKSKLNHQNETPGFNK